jgi:branched-chain amino acid transport system substrate-binding protein
MHKTLSRRSLVKGAAGAALAVDLPLTAIAEEAPVKIGLLTIKTGPLAPAGIQMEQGTTLFIKDANYTMAGRKVELVVADTGGNPVGAKTKAQELIERDNVDLIFGPLRRSNCSLSATMSPAGRCRS